MSSWDKQLRFQRWWAITACLQCLMSLMPHKNKMPSFAVCKIIMVPSQGSVLTDTSLPFVVQGLQPGGIWKKLLLVWQFCEGEELNASSADLTVTTFPNLEPLLSSDDCFILLLEKVYIMGTGEECGDLSRSQDNFLLKRTAQYQEHIGNNEFNRLPNNVGRVWTETHFYFGGYHRE